jgi:hypothetical protein
LGRRRISKKSHGNAGDHVGEVMRALGDGAAEHEEIQNQQGHENAAKTAQRQGCQNRDGRVKRRKGGDAARRFAQHQRAGFAQPHQMVERRGAGKLQDSEVRTVDKNDRPSRRQQG